MCLSQSVVLWQGMGGIQKIALFGKRASLYYGKNSSKKQRETTVHHYFKTWRSVNPENFKNFERFFKCSRKTIKRNDETGSHEVRHRKGRPRVTSAAEDKFIRVTSLRNCSPSISRVQVTETTSAVQRRLCESGLHGWISSKKPLPKDTNKKKRYAWAKKYEQWILDWCKSVLWSDESKCEIFGSNRHVFIDAE